MCPAVPTMTDFISDSIDGRDVHFGPSPVIARRQERRFYPSLAPFLQARPDLRQAAELRATAKEDGKLALQRIGIVARSAHEIHTIEKRFQSFAVVVENDQTIAGISTRPPQPPRLMSAERGR